MKLQELKGVGPKIQEKLNKLGIYQVEDLLFHIPSKYLDKTTISPIFDLKEKFEFIGDVRGMGLFIGIEIIKNDGAESPELCAYIKNKMRENRVLLGSDGPKDNVIKIRPPLTIDLEDAQMLLETFSGVLDGTQDWHYE